MHFRHLAINVVLLPWLLIAYQAHAQTENYSIADIDQNGLIDATTDGVLLLRYLFGFRGDALINAATDRDNCQRCTADAITAHLEQTALAFDIDGDGGLDALSDAMLLLRYLRGYRDSTLLGGAINERACRRCDPDSVSEYIEQTLLAATAYHAILRIDTGLLVGTQIGEVLGYLGIPYAHPPTGPRRWQPPQAASPWQGVRAATQQPNPCTQPGELGYSENGIAVGTEDCLYLNVWTPSIADTHARRPVLVFLHGGGNFLGSTRDPISLVAATTATDPLYDGARLSARGNVVVVTLNYRLGVLGFMPHPELDAESPTGSSGNDGLLDQIAALHWVQNNIDLFGGDPDRVLLFGQSGGGRDVVLLATSPLTRGLFAAVAIHSAPLGAQTATSGYAQTGLLVEEMDCAGLHSEVACLRAIAGEALVLADAAQPLGLAAGAFRPIVDGHVVLGQPRDLIARGDHAGLPMLLGNLEDEYSHRWAGLTDAGYPEALAATFGADRAAEVLAQYPVSRFNSAHEAYVTLMSDKNVTCPYREFARIASRAGILTYVYRFRQRLMPEARLGYGVYHTSELLYLFQHMSGRAFPASDTDRATETIMRTLWSQFAATGDPNDAAILNWPPFEPSSEAYLSLAGEPAAGFQLKQQDCDFWLAFLAGTQ